MKKKLVFLATMVLSVLLAACGDTTGKEGGADTQNTTLKVGITQDLDSLDPHVAVAAGTDEVLFNIFEGLVKVDENGTMQPAVAESYAISEDAMTYTFVLRENVHFHNGDIVTTEDVIYSLKRSAGFEGYADANVHVESALSIISDIKAEGRNIVVSLSQANTELIYYLTSAIIPANYKNQASSPVGTGPYKFVSYEPLQSMVMERFEDYYGAKPAIKTVTFAIYANTDAAFLELLAGGIDLMTQLTADQTAQLKDKYDIEAANYNLVQALFLNHEFKPFSDINVRKALCYAVDRDAINQMISEGQGTIIGSGMYPRLQYYYDCTGYYKRDVAKAKELLAAAGYPNGFEFTITIPSSYDSHVQTGEIIVEQLKEVGITAKINLIEWQAWLSDVYKGRQYEATIIGLDANLAPGDILKRYRTTASNNFVNYVNENFDTYYYAALNSTETNVKAENYKRCQELLAEDAVSVYIQDPAQLTAVKKGLKGYTSYPIYVLDVSKLYWSK